MVRPAGGARFADAVEPIEKRVCIGGQNLRQTCGEILEYALTAPLQETLIAAVPSARLLIRPQILTLLQGSFPRVEEITYSKNNRGYLFLHYVVLHALI